MTGKHKFLLIFSITFLLMVSSVSFAHAVKYPDWIFQDFTSAYTLHKNDFEITASWLVMNETIDFLDVKEKSIGNSNLFTASLGDYSGGKFLINYGLTDRLMFNGFYQKAKLDSTLGSSSTFKDIDSTQSLDTTTFKAGVRFKLMPEKRRTPAVSLELSYRKNNSDDAGFAFSELNSSSFPVPKGNNSLMLRDLSDSGYSFNLIASKNLEPFVHTLFAGFGRYSSDSSLNLLIDSNTMKADLTQKFEMDENIYSLGYTLGLKFFERMPIFISYTYLKTDVDMKGSSNTLSGFIPDHYLNTENMENISSNHIISGKLVYWITPHVNLTLDGTIYKNHFLGIVPHYNNSLTNKFFDYRYGYISLGVGVAF